jgi:hypothetical protein
MKAHLQQANQVLHYQPSGVPGENYNSVDGNNAVNVMFLDLAEPFE